MLDIRESREFIAAFNRIGAALESIAEAIREQNKKEEKN